MQEKLFLEGGGELRRLGGKASLPPVDRTLLQDYLASEGITWKFNLSNSLWWGGMHEQLIKDIKTLGKTLLKVEQLEAVILDIERYLSNRPLIYVESDSGEEQVPTRVWKRT